EEVVCEILQLNDAEGVICLPNEEFFAGLARMGYEKPSTELTFYKAFFSTQWKFFIHTILHSLSTKRTSWNEFSSKMASALICLSSGQSDSPLLGVNTPRSDEDRLELMELMVFLMINDVCDEFGLNAARFCCQENLDAAQGFEQIIDFLSGSYIHHAITVNPHVYISCIKQFWNTAMVKHSGDVTRLQALVDKKRIVITEEVVREILQLNDAEGVICLPNDEIFAGLARMGYEKPSTKLTFNKAFFSTQWKFFIHTILHSLSDKRTSWNEFSYAMASALICLSSGQRVGKGFSGVEIPLFENMLAVRTVDAEEEVQLLAQDDVVQENVIEEVAAEVVPPTPTSPSPSSPVIPSTPPHQSPSPPQSQAAKGSSHLVQQVLDKCSVLVLRVEGLENANAAQQLEIIKLKARVKKLERLNKVKSSKLRPLKKVGTSQRVESSEDIENVFNQGRISVDIDEGVELVVCDTRKILDF
nr:hypothetical protein [Tanacetum cinerariifolium]